MVLKKARRAPVNLQSESPVVSDDDGIDIGFDPSAKSFIPDDDVQILNEDPEPLANDPGEESDSSSDGNVNPVGDIPMRWYEGYDHIGYDRSGEKIIRRNKPSALDLAADPSAWRRVYDEKNDEQIVLTHDELKAVARMRAGRYPAAGVDADDELVNWSGAPLQHPLTSAPDPKRRFLPSRHEARLIVRLVRGMRAGTIKRPSEREREAQQEEEQYRYDVWESHEPKTRDEMTKSERARDIMRVPAPKPPLPMHGESYNPPEEYLPTEDEAKEWSGLEREERVTSYLPQKHAALRHVPLYDDFIKERFERCLDLYLAVRVIKDQRKVDPDELVPDLPSPRELRPFPTEVIMSFGPLPSRARSIDVHPSGQWLLSGSDDGCVRVWEVATGHLQHTWQLGELVDKIDGLTPAVSAVAWCPKEKAHVFGASIGRSLIIVGAAAALGIASEESDMAMERAKGKVLDEKVVEKMKEGGIVWEERNLDDDVEEGAGADKDGGGHKSVERQCPMLVISHARALRTFCWHRKGDYLGCVGRDSSGGMVAIHRVSQRWSQVPFKKKSALVQAVKFHPTRPFLLVATMHHVRVYNLAVQQLVKRLRPGVSWISSMDVHPGGDHVVVTSYDKRVCWFDLDLSTRPYKTLRHHDKAVRVGKFHPRLPLFADGADDGSCQVLHARVFDDLSKNALIVPVQRLHGCSRVVESLGVLDVAWHPRLAWLFTSGADGRIRVAADCSQG